MTSKPQMKPMFRVEKFYPTHCPSCQHRLDLSGKDWIEIIRKIPDPRGSGEANLPPYQVLRCLQCGNHTLMLQLESYQLASRERALDFCREQGFVNLTEVQACGNMAQDSHCIYNPIQPHGWQEFKADEPDPSQIRSI